MKKTKTTSSVVVFTVSWFKTNAYGRKCGSETQISGYYYQFSMALVSDHTAMTQCSYYARKNLSHVDFGCG
jgi:hypothetical protein